VEMEEERSYSVMERLLFYTLPVLFTLLLTGVLLTVFGYDVVNELLKAGNKVPGVAAVLPDPKPSEAELREAMRAAEEQAASAGEAEPGETAAVRAELAAKEAEVAQLRAETAEMEQQIAQLQAELETKQAAEEQAAAEIASEEEYAANVKKLASVYGGMSASKAAPLLENLTLSERVLVMREMDEEEQVDIFEKMDPAVAAETSILLKDVVPSRDLQIAALQERLALGGAAAEASAELTTEELSRTIAQMTPDRAAEVLLEMEQSQVVLILRGMEEASRATILDSLAELDKERTAQIAARLG